MSFQDVTNSIFESVKQHAPEILTGVGIVGMLTTTVLAVKATPKAMKLIEEAERRKKGPLTMFETVRTAGKCYILPAITATGAIVCLVLPNRMYTQKYTALAALYSAKESAFQTYQTKVIETIGEKKEQKIRDAINQDDIYRHPYRNAKVHVQKKGEVLCYEVKSKTYFYSDAETIRQYKNDFKEQLGDELYLSYTDWLIGLGCPPDNPRDTDIVGWNSDDKKNFDIKIGCQLADDGTPCLTIAFDMLSQPRIDYKDWRKTRN